MMSSDREILIAINGRLERIESQQARNTQQIAEIRKDTDQLSLRVNRIEDQLTDLKNYINTWFTVIAVVIAIVGALSPLLQRKDSPSIISVSQPDVNDIARRVSELLKNKGG